MCLAEQDTEARIKLVGKLFTATWGPKAPGVTEPLVLERLAAEIGLEGGRLLERATSVDVKTALREATAEAIAAGAFGVPSMAVDGELFWGVDSLAHLDRFLRGADPIDAAAMQRWQDLPALIQRKRP